MKPRRTGNPCLWALLWPAGAGDGQKVRISPQSRHFIGSLAHHRKGYEKPFSSQALSCHDEESMKTDETGGAALLRPRAQAEEARRRRGELVRRGRWLREGSER